MRRHLISRRGFLLGAAASGAAFSLFPSRALGANERVNIGIIGLGGKGSAHNADFSKIPNANIIALCDADRNHLDDQADLWVKRHPDGGTVAKYQDLRKLLENKDVDAVVIATPDHWHCLAAILAFQAGKHAYVEKPVSYCIWEGRKMVEAARKYNRIVQAGTQQRSCPAVQECAKDIQSGKYGKVLWVHCCKLDSREPIGKVTAPTPVPEGVDYELWAGPAPKTPVMRKNFHYDWHWQWPWGTGEMGNWGVHYLDDMRNLLGWDDVPNNVMAAGNRWWPGGTDDDGETPNMHLSYMEHRGVKIVIDIRNMKGSAKGSEGAVYLPPGFPKELRRREGNFIACEGGFIQMVRGGGKAMDKDGKLIKQYKGTGGAGHDANFINAIRQGSNASLACEIEVGHLSTTLCHLANIGFRVGKAAPVDELRANLKQHEDAVNTLETMLEQLKVNEVDLAKKPFIVGPKLTYDTKVERFTGDHADEANLIVKRQFRAPFVVPETV